MATVSLEWRRASPSHSPLIEKIGPSTRRALGHHLSRKESLVWLKDGHRKKKSHSWFGSYMKDAQRIARSLPEHPQPVCIPDGVDPNLVLFKI
ncbi:hypothetical protein HPP92_005396 [Vanilla planifolia]|uniref:Uncharacterized protein n=1 Tax=Vanilla planifolia TaxID=51239 RepID=A0A835RZG4_VANPL|nr:hypothetical protein HPP92_005396 [Vanilla planifolia]